jgi:hypothetical protein
MNVDWAVRAAAALAVALVAGAAAWLATRGTESSQPLQQFAVRADLEPRTQLFGDPITALVDIELDRRLVDPESVRVQARFRPYSVTDARREVRRSGNVVAIRHSFALLCIAPACTPSGGPLQLDVPRARVRYRLRAGGRRTVAAQWPASYVMSRITGAVIPTGEDVRIPWPWRWPSAPPPVSYRVSPPLLAGIGFALSGALVLLAGVLLAPALRPLLRLAARREDPLAGLPPLERALALVELAVASGAAADQRKALDRLARELRVHGDHDLARAARRLAWSAPVPGDEVGALRAAVARAAGGRA